MIIKGTTTIIHTITKGTPTIIHMINTLLIISKLSFLVWSTPHFWQACKHMQYKIVFNNINECTNSMKNNSNEGVQWNVQWDYRWDGKFHKKNSTEVS